MNFLWLAHTRETTWKLLSAQKLCMSYPQNFQPVGDQRNACRKYCTCSLCCCISPWVLVLGPCWSQDAGLEIWPRTTPVIKYCSDSCVPDFAVWLDWCSAPIIWKNFVQQIQKSKEIFLILRSLPRLLIKSFSFALFAHD